MSNKYDDLDPDEQYIESSIVTPESNNRNIEEYFEEEVREKSFEKDKSYKEESGSEVDDDFFNKFATPEQTNASRGASKRNMILATIGVALSLYAISLYIKATSAIEQDEIRKVSEAAKLPQDLNMTDDSVLWHTAKDAEIENLQRELNMMRAGGMYKDENGSQAQGNLTAENQDNVSKSDVDKMIASAVREALRSQMNTNGRLRPPPSPVNVEVLPQKFKTIAKKDGNVGTLSVDDFLVVPDSKQAQAPKTVASAQSNGNAMLPPMGSNATPPPNGSIPIPSLSGNNYTSSAGTKIIDAPELKSGRIGANGKDGKDKKPYFMMSGLAKATLHTGFRAPTLSVGENNTQPVYMSVDSQVVTANDDNIDIEDCTVMGTSRGNLNSGRAEIRLSELNCVVHYKNGKRGRISEKVNGWVYGEDGVFGLKGRLVSSEGKVLESAMPIAMIQALIGSLSQLGQTSQQVSSLGLSGGTLTGTTSIPSADQMKNGALQGFSQSMNQSLSQVVDYYISILKEMNPAIEILGGRNRLTILFKGGEEMKENDYEPVNLGKIREGR